MSLMTDYTYQVLTDARAGDPGSDNSTQWEHDHEKQ